MDAMDEKFVSRLIESSMRQSRSGMAVCRIIQDPEGNPVDFEFVEANEAYEALIGIPERIIVGQKASSLFHGHFKENDEWLAICGDIALNGGNQIIEWESRVIGKWLRVNILCPHPGYFTMFLFDITRVKKSEEALKLTEREFRNIVENAPVGIYRTTPDGRILMANEFLLKMLGYQSLHDLAQRNLEAEGYEPGYSRDKFLERIMRDGEVIGLESAWKTKDGRTLMVNESARMVKDDDGSILYFEGMVEDITARKNVEEQIRKINDSLKQAITTRDLFFSIIAHDLRNPFNTILGFSNILWNEATKLENEAITQYAGIIRSSATQAHRLAENLLEWAKIQNGQMPFQPRGFLLNTVIQSELSAVSTSALQKMITMSCRVEDSIGVFADENMVAAVVRNLISNALKFTGANGEVEITATERNNMAEVSVSDTGIGMTNAEMMKLFRIESVSTTVGTQNEKGSGLGLLLCHEFITKNGGTIRVESEAGKGSTFIFTLPLTSEQESLE